MFKSKFKLKDAYKEGVEMKKFKHIKEISNYNHNYYNGYGTDLLLGIGDDDNITDRRIILGKDGCVPIGYSHTSQGDKLIKGCNT